MSVSLYSNEYVARIEQDRKEAMSLMLAVIYSYGIEFPQSYIDYLDKWEQPLPPRRNSAVNNE